MIFNAEDLTLQAHLTGSDLVLFGLHAQFFPSHVGIPVKPAKQPTADPPSRTTDALDVTDGCTSLNAVMWITVVLLGSMPCII